MTTLRDLWDSGQPTVGGWCNIPSAFSAELLGRSGFDWVCIDTQHGLAGQDVMVEQLQALAITGTPGFVRVTWNEPDLIMRALDAGAQGVIVPMVNTADDARRAAGACRYAPRGYRSWGPIRAALGRPDFSVETANREVVCAVMIETEQALRNLDEILAVDGVDAVYVGPSDLAVSLGMAPTGDPSEARHVEAVEAIVDGCRRQNIVAGIHCGSVETARRWLARGFSMVNVNNDAIFVRTSSLAVLKALKHEPAPPEASSKSGYA